MWYFFFINLVEFEKVMAIYRYSYLTSVHSVSVFPCKQLFGVYWFHCFAFLPFCSLNMDKNQRNLVKLLTSFHKLQWNVLNQIKFDLCEYLLLIDLMDFDLDAIWRLQYSSFFVDGFGFRRELETLISKFLFLSSCLSWLLN